MTHTFHDLAHSHLATIGHNPHPQLIRTCQLNLNHRPRKRSTWPKTTTRTTLRTKGLSRIFAQKDSELVLKRPQDISIGEI